MNARSFTFGQFTHLEIGIDARGADGVPMGRFVVESKPTATTGISLVTWCPRGVMDVGFQVCDVIWEARDTDEQIRALVKHSAVTAPRKSRLVSLCGVWGGAVRLTHAGACEVVALLKAVCEQGMAAAAHVSNANLGSKYGWNNPDLLAVALVQGGFLTEGSHVRRL